MTELPMQNFQTDSAQTDLSHSIFFNEANMFLPGYKILEGSDAGVNFVAVFDEKSGQKIWDNRVNTPPSEELLICISDSIAHVTKHLMSNLGRSNDEQLVDFLSLKFESRNIFLNFYTPPNVKIIDLNLYGDDHVWTFDLKENEKISISKIDLMPCIHLYENIKFCNCIEKEIFTWKSIYSNKENKAHCLFISYDVGFVFVQEENKPSYITGLNLADLKAFCVYIPEIDICFGWNSGWQSLSFNFITQHTNWLHLSAQKALFDCGKEIINWLGKDATPTGNIMWPENSAHLGHYIWNELSGLAILVEKVPENKLPIIWNLSNRGLTDFYGPLEWIFPEFEGRVDRRFSDFQSLNSYLITTGTQALRVSSSYVTANLRARLVQAIKKAPNTPISLDVQELIFPDNMPVILLGLREGKRTLTNTVELYLDAISGLKDKIGRFGVVIDGLNSAPGNKPRPFRVFFADQTVTNPIEAEMRIVDKIKRFCKDNDIPCVSLVGSSMDMCLSYITRCNFFIAPWGGGLAKYKWIANIPGYVLASAHNLRHPFILSIYHSDTFMENSTPVYYPDENMIVDLGEGVPGAQSDVDYIAKYEIISDILDKTLIHIS